LSKLNSPWKKVTALLVAMFLTLFGMACLNSADAAPVVQQSPASPANTHADPARAASEPATDDQLLAYWTANVRAPAQYVIDKFHDHKWVFLGEYHRVKHDADLVVALIPLLHEQTPVRHLATEFLCVDSTDEANALVTAADYDRRRTIDFFRNQFVGWSYEEYVGVFEAVWRSNRALADKRGVFQLVGLNPCPDWEVINHSDDDEARAREQKKSDRYDAVMAEALERNLLKPGRPALVHSGIAHTTGKFVEYRYGTDEPLPRMGNLVYVEPYKRDMFFICLHAPFWDAGSGKDIYPFDGRLDRLMARFQKDIGFDVVGTPFEQMTHEIRSPRAITAYTFGQLYDGYIMHKTPIKEYVGVTCIADWIVTEAQFRHYYRHVTNAKASRMFSEMSFDEFKKDFCAPRADFGPEFKRRFRKLPDPP